MKFLNNKKGVLIVLPHSLKFKNNTFHFQSQKRRRTPGGVFFFLVKNDRHLPQGVIKTIFDDPKKRILEKQKKQMNKRRKKMERAQKNKELKKKLQGNDTIIIKNLNLKKKVRHMCEKKKV